MKNKYLWLFIVLIMMGNTVSIHASNAGIYLADATAHYAHPVTGEVEDPGNNAGIGQSMTENVLSSSALIEIDTNGKIYATVRLFMTDQISKVEFWTQKRGASGWNSVSATIMQENAGGKLSNDYRFAIPAENAIVRTSCYVDAMGRAVVFYFDFSGLKSGSSDFVTSIKVEETSSDSTSSNNETQQSPQVESETATQSVTLEEAVSGSQDSATLEKQDFENDSPQEQLDADDSAEGVSENLSALKRIEQAQGLTTSLGETAEGDAIDATENAVDESEQQKTVTFASVFQIVAAAILAGVVTGGILIALIGTGAYFILRHR